MSDFEKYAELRVIEATGTKKGDKISLWCENTENGFKRKIHVQTDPAFTKATKQIVKKPNPKTGEDMDITTYPGLACMEKDGKPLLTVLIKNAEVGTTGDDPKNLGRWLYKGTMEFAGPKGTSTYEYKHVKQEQTGPAGPGQ